MLELQNLQKFFATQKAVDDISFNLEKGSIFGLLGPNGAGKTTLIRMITGIFYPDNGKIIPWFSCLELLFIEEKVLFGLGKLKINPNK